MPPPPAEAASEATPYRPRLPLTHVCPKRAFLLKGGEGGKLESRLSEKNSGGTPKEYRQKIDLSAKAERIQRIAWWPNANQSRCLPIVAKPLQQVIRGVDIAEKLIFARQRTAAHNDGHAASSHLEQTLVGIGRRPEVVRR